MRRLVLGWVATVALTGATTAAASAASVSVDAACYLARQAGLPNGQSVVLTGSGFAADRSDLRVTLGARELGTVSSDAEGRVLAGFMSPSLRAGRNESVVTLNVSDGTTSAQARVRVTRFGVDFVPRQGNVATTRVRLSVFGFAPLLALRGKGPVQRIYEHVLAPNGRLRGTFPLGRSRGPCGTLVVRGRRLLPVRTRAGVWRLVFDTSARWRATSVPRTAIRVKVRSVRR